MTTTTISTLDGPIVIERPDDGIAVMRLSKRLDVYTAPAVRQASVDLVNAGAYRIVVDLGPTEFIDSTGLGVLLGMLKRARGHAGTVVVADMDERVAQVFRVTGLMRYLEQYPTVDEAVTALEGSAAAGSAPVPEEPIEIAALRRPAREIAGAEFTREIRITPSNDHRDDPSNDLGAHGCDLFLVLRGPLGAIAARINTGWVARPLAGHFVPGIGAQRRRDRPGTDATLATTYPTGGYVGSHSQTSRNGWAANGPCDWLGTETCYGDGSYLMADEILALLTTGGSDAAFERLAELYQAWLVAPAADPTPEDGAPCGG